MPDTVTINIIEGSGGTWGQIVGTLSSQTDLQTALDAKAASSHTHPQGEIVDLVADLAAVDTALAGKAPISHTHAQSEVIDLVADLASKQATLTGTADVPGLQTALDAKAAASHSHVISDTTGLQIALDAKQANLTGTADVPGLDTALASKTAVGHTHPQGEITNLVADLAGKASSTHSHAISDTTGLQTALDAKQSQDALLDEIAGLTIGSVGQVMAVAPGPVLDFVDVTGGITATTPTENVLPKFDSGGNVVDSGIIDASSGGSLKLNHTAGALGVIVAPRQGNTISQADSTGTTQDYRIWYGYASYCGYRSIVGGGELYTDGGAAGLQINALTTQFVVGPPLVLPARAEPAAPASGGSLYWDSTANELRIKAASGTVYTVNLTAV